ncbi:MAG: M28 family peptidase [Gemmatimonadota bacterium]
MTDFDFPDLPSDEELGITDEDRKAYEEEGEDRPEMSDAEMAALLGEAPGSKQAGAPAAGAAGAAASAGKSPKAGGEKTSTREERRAAKEAKKAARAAEKAARKAAKQAGADSGKGAPAAPKTSKSDESPKAPKVSTALAGPRIPWRGPATVIALVVMAGLSTAGRYAPQPVPANAPESEFSSARAMATLIEIARAPHPVGSPEHARVRDFLVDRLEQLGLEPEVQTGVAHIQGNGRGRAATTRNIVARIEGTEPTGAFLITAHYDARDQSLGAADAGSGVVAILEAVRAAQTGEPFRNDVIILITDAEEIGLMGARTFAAEHRWMEDVRVAVSLEMRGSDGPAIMFETNDQNGWIVRQFAESDPYAYANSLAFEVYQRMPNDTDFTILKEAGVQGLNFAGIDGAPAYHQRYDDPGHLSESTLQHHGEHALASMRHFGQVDLSEVNAPNAVYITIPLLGMVVYDVVVGHALSAIVAILFGLALLVSGRTGARPGRVVVGTVVALACAAAAGGVGFALMSVIPGFHGEFGGLQGSALHQEGWYVLTLVAAAAAIVWSVSIVARRWLHLSELALGAALVPAVASIAVGFTVPLAAVNLHWPALAATSAVLLLGIVGDRLKGHAAWAFSLLAAGVVLVVLAPIVETLWLAMSIRLAIGLGILSAITIQLCLPVLDSLRHPNDWWSPLAALAAAGIFFGVASQSGRPSAERPAPSTLAYAYEHGSGSAYWVTEPTDHPGDALATEWAEERVGAFESTINLSEFGYPNVEASSRDALVVDADRPEIVTLRDEVVGRRRVVDLAVRSRVGAELLQFRYGDAGTTQLISVAGVRVDDPGSLTVFEHWGIPEHGYVLIELEGPADEPLDLYVTEHLLRPTELLGESPFERPAELAPNPNWLSDRVMLRTSVGQFGDPAYAVVEVDPVPDGLAELLRSGGAPAEAGRAEGSPEAGDEIDAAATADTIDGASDTATIDTTATTSDSIGAGPDSIASTGDSVAVDTIGSGSR